MHFNISLNIVSAKFVTEPSRPMSIIDHLLSLPIDVILLKIGKILNEKTSSQHSLDEAKQQVEDE